MSECDERDLGIWQAAQLADVVALFSQYDAPWWIGGGVAIDLFVGSSNITHKDIDVGIVRRDVAALAGVLSGWEVFEARSGSLTRLAVAPHRQTNSLWCRRGAVEPWSIEVLLDDADGSDWIFRRAPVIRRSLIEIIRHTAAGVPYLSPEIQLLYKSKQIRPRDQTDFERALPRLDGESRRWLHQALAILQPDHPWHSALRDALA